MNRRWVRITLAVAASALVVAAMAVSTWGWGWRPRPTRVSCRLNGPAGPRYGGLYESDFENPDQGAKCVAVLRPGKSDQDAVESVASGRDEFGIVSAPELIRARARGLPLVGVGIFHRESPVCFIARKGSGINKPQDFVGRVVGVRRETDISVQYGALMDKLHIDRSRIREVPVGTDMTPFFTGRVDVWPGYTFDDPIAAQEKGIAVNTIRPWDYGVRMYGDVLFTTQAYSRKHDGIVLGVVVATQMGWRRVRNSADRIALRHAHWKPGPQYEHELRVLEASGQVFVGSLQTPFRWDRDVWRETQRMLLDQGAVSRPVDLSRVCDESFLMRCYPGYSVNPGM